jgi:hypothetical protein
MTRKALTPALRLQAKEQDSSGDEGGAAKAPAKPRKPVSAVGSAPPPPVRRPPPLAPPTKAVAYIATADLPSSEEEEEEREKVVRQVRGLTLEARSAQRDT